MSEPRPAEADAARIGMLLETAHSQQEAIAAQIEHLQDHARGLDQIVRAEIRRTLLEELNEINTQGGQTVAALQELERTARRRSVGLSIGLATLSAIIGSASIAWYLPTPAEIERLRVQRDAMRTQVEQLEEAGGGLALRRCGRELRWCVRVDRSAPAFGAEGDYRVVRGR